MEKVELCILCGKFGRLTREHRFPRKLVDEFAGSGNLKGFFGNGKKIDFENSKNAKILRPKKNICEKCNHIDSQPCDNEFYRLVLGAREYSRNNPSNIPMPSSEEILAMMIEKIGEKDNYDVADIATTLAEMLSLREIIITDPYLKHNEIKRFIAKYTACYCDRHNMKIPSVCRDAFCDLKNLDSIHFTLAHFNESMEFGCIATRLQHYKNEEGEYYFYRLVFGHVFVQVKIIL